MTDCVKYEIHGEVAGLPNVVRRLRQQGTPMTDAVIVSTARTGLAKSWKGAFNMTYGGGQGAAGLFEVC